jgi:hypothetical protein
MRKIALLCFLLLVFALSVALAETPVSDNLTALASQTALAPATPAAAPSGKPGEPVLPFLQPEPQLLCVQCSVQQERQCDATCVLQGHVSGACAFCSRTCVCFD